jgi:hypothetical protein
MAGGVFCGAVADKPFVRTAPVNVCVDVSVSDEKRGIPRARKNTAAVHYSIVPVLLDSDGRFQLRLFYARQELVKESCGHSLSNGCSEHGGAVAGRIPALAGIAVGFLRFWAADGFVQLLLGFDLFGIAMNPDRLNALFFSKYQFYGPVLAILSPLMLEYARRRWPAWAWVVSFALVLGAVPTC